MCAPPFNISTKYFPAHIPWLSQSWSNWGQKECELHFISLHMFTESWSQKSTTYQSLIFYSTHRGSLTSRIVWTLAIEIVIFVITIILAMIDSTTWPGIFFYLTILTVIILNSESQINEYIILLTLKYKVIHLIWDLGWGWLGFWAFHCLTLSAWADGNLAEAAVQLGKKVEHPNKSQPNPGPQADGTPCV